MNFALTTIGSTGDLQPFLALALALQSAGHRVRVCSHDIFAERFAKAGVEYVAVGAPLDEVRWQRAWQRLDAAGDNIVKQVDALIDELFLHGAQQHFADCLEAMRGFDAVICHHGDFLGQEAAARLGLPWAGVFLCPGAIRTPLNPPLHGPFLGRFLNGLVWKVGQFTMRHAQRRIDALLREIGAKRDEVSLSQIVSPTLNLVAASPAVARVPPDLPRTFVTTGHWRVEEPAYQIPAELAEFLAAEDAPIVVSFGSMGGAGGERTAQLLIEAASRVGQRMVIQRGFGRIATDNAKPDRVCFVDFMPHDSLFPHASVIVHHGGAGTTTAAARSGRPSIVAPHIADQTYWAMCLRRAGVAPRPLRRSKLTAEQLAIRLRQVSNHPQMVARAKVLGEQVRAEKGTELAVVAIERWMATQRMTATVAQ